MYRLLIVDDEVFEREGIRRSIEWKKYGIDQVDLAENGLEGLKMFQENPYDIVISDIKMPLMDGLSMAEKMRDTLVDVKIIFISGHEEFSYVKKALQIHAVDYLLKPVGEALESKIQDVTHLLDKKYSQLEEQMLFSESYYHEKKLLGIEAIDFFLGEQWPLMIRILDNLRCLEKQYISCVFCIIKEVPTAIKEDIWRTLQKKCAQLFGKGVVGFLEDKLFCVFPSAEKLDDLQKKRLLSGMDMYICKDAKGILKLKSDSFSTKENINEMLAKWKENDIQEMLEVDRDPNGYSHLVKKMIVITQKKYMENITIRQISEELMYSPNYLSMLFKKETGQGFYNYLLTLRIEKAKKLILEGNSKIYQVANAVGYEDTVAFIKRFRKEVGCTPSQYRDTMGKGKVHHEKESNQ